MKYMLCFGDSNTWGHNPEAKNENELRYSPNKRWTGKLAQALQGKWVVIEEGLCGRSTVFEDPLSSICNGAKALPICLRSHQPLDLIIFMLGTNDSRTIFHANAKEISRGMEYLLKMAQSQESYDIKQIPQILLIAPPHLSDNLKNTFFYGIYDEESAEKLRLLGETYRELARQYHCMYLDAGECVKEIGSDGVHLSEAGHEKLYRCVMKLLLEEYDIEKEVQYE